VRGRHSRPPRRRPAAAPAPAPAPGPARRAGPARGPPPRPDPPRRAPRVRPCRITVGPHPGHRYTSFTSVDNFVRRRGSATHAPPERPRRQSLGGGPSRCPVVYVDQGVATGRTRSQARPSGAWEAAPRRSPHGGQQRTVPICRSVWRPETQDPAALRAARARPLAGSRSRPAAEGQHPDREPREVMARPGPRPRPDGAHRRPDQGWPRPRPPAYPAGVLAQVHHHVHRAGDRREHGRRRTVRPEG